jgi:hypothetical protein
MRPFHERRGIEISILDAYWGNHRLEGWVRSSGGKENDGLWLFHPITRSRKPTC